MRLYNPALWVCFFFFYAFAGWVWESCYVSLLNRRWINRGILSGPILPIYGFGALAVLFLTAPAAHSPLSTALAGMAWATALELLTGLVLDKLFSVRYWDYTQWPLNLGGYISLPSSLFWGALSLILVQWVHPALSVWVAGTPLLPLLFLSSALLTVTGLDLVHTIRSVPAPS